MADFNDTRMESMMGTLLRFGVVLASTVVLAGGVFYLQDHRGQQADYRSFVTHPLSLRHPAQLLDGLGRGQAAALIDLGILPADRDADRARSVRAGGVCD